MTLFRREKGSENTLSFGRRIELWLNRQRLGYGVLRRGCLFQIIVPVRIRKRLTLLKYAITIVGLFSAFIIFGSVVHSFLFGLGLFVLGSVLERTVFSHFAGFMHALPTEAMNSALWVGISFGEHPDLATGTTYPALAMVVTERSYAEQMRDLILKWSGGSYRDTEKNVCVSIVRLDMNSYIFLCYPNMNCPVARQSFEQAKRELRESSLDDVLMELHCTPVFGKRCYLSPNSPFPRFLESYEKGMPVVLRFGVPFQGNVKILDDIPSIFIHSFKVKEKDKLTRKDFEREGIHPFETGGEWQGPPEQAPEEV